jgi:hypothetical protein
MSCAIKRLIGTGTVEMTTDNGTTWTPVTVTAGWTIVSIPAQTLVNPVCGFRLATSGDSVAIDVVQNESGTGSVPPANSPTTPLITTSATVTRFADDLQLTGTNFSNVYNQTEGTIVLYFSTDNLAADSTILCIDDEQLNQINQVDWRSLASVALRTRVRSANASSCDINPGSFGFGVLIKVAHGFRLNNFASSINGNAVPTPDTTGDMPLTNMTRLTFGQRGITSLIQGILHLRSLDLYSIRQSNSVLPTLSTP